MHIIDASAVFYGDNDEISGFVGLKSRAHRAGTYGINDDILSSHKVKSVVKARYAVQCPHSVNAGYAKSSFETGNHIAHSSPDVC